MAEERKTPAARRSTTKKRTAAKTEGTTRAAGAKPKPAAAKANTASGKASPTAWSERKRSLRATQAKTTRAKASPAAKAKATKPARESSEEAAPKRVDEDFIPTAPSLGPHTVIEREPVEQRLAKHEQSEVDAMGKDKRRSVVGQTYGPTWARQATLYGAFLAIVAALAIGGKMLADKLDEPPASNPDKAPWSQSDAKQIPPKPIQ